MKLPQIVIDLAPQNFKRLFVLKAFYRRDFVTFDRLLQRIQRKDPVFVEFCNLLKKQFLEGDVSFDEWSSLLKKAEHVDILHVIHRRIYTEMITKALHNQDHGLAQQLLEQKIVKFGFQVADVQLSNGIIRMCMSQDKLNEAHKFRDWLPNNVQKAMWKNYIDFKLMEVTLDLESRTGSTFDNPLWKIALDRIANLEIPTTIRDNFSKIAPVYFEIEKKYPLFLDVRTSDSEKKSVHEIIRNNLKEKKPFLMLRLGDGESYGLPAPNGISDEDRIIRENKWWGKKLSNELRQKQIRYFQDTLKHTDMIGIPGVFRFTRDLWSSVQFFNYSMFKPQTTVRGLNSVMNYIADGVASNVFESKSSFVEHRCHQALFKLEDVREMAEHAAQLIIISQYEEGRMLSLFKHPSIYVIQIPKERMGDSALPFTIDVYVENLRKIASPGSLVLVSAGFAGKYFLKIAKDAGAVALDVGAMADYWLGFKTRSIADIV